MMKRSSGMGGARMLRAMGRSIGAGVKDKMSSSAAAAAHGSKPGKTAARVVSVSSPPSPPPSSSSSASRGSLSCYCELDEWETIGEDGNVISSATAAGFAFADRRVFGPAPTKEEAEEAVSTIQQIFVPVTLGQVAEVGYLSSVDEDVVDKVITSSDELLRDSSTESESDWIEPALHLYSSKSSQPYSQENILDAVHMLQINAPFKRMVSSLSSDPAVWDAVMKNEVVQELKKSFYEAKSSESDILDEDDDLPKGILKWIMDGTKGKIMEFLDTISRVVNDIFHFHDKEKAVEAEPFNNFVRSSFMLSVVVFIIVVMTRIQKS